MKAVRYLRSCEAQDRRSCPWCWNPCVFVCGSERVNISTSWQSKLSLPVAQTWQTSVKCNPRPQGHRDGWHSQRHPTSWVTGSRYEIAPRKSSTSEPWATTRGSRGTKSSELSGRPPRLCLMARSHAWLQTAKLSVPTAAATCRILTLTRSNTLKNRSLSQWAISFL